jgi:NADH-quinone oxidoreductase subunit H
MSDALFTWIASLIKAVLVFAVLMSMVPLLIWLERKVVAWMQQRIGPNRCGPFGLLQPMADAVKLIIKENIIPAGVDRVTYFLAPVLSIVPALAAFAVVPFGEPVTIFGRTVELQVANVNIGILYILALSSLAVYGVTLAGWSSNNKYSLLGALRSSAQMISYEIPIGLAVVTVVLMAGSLNLKDIVDAQRESGFWFVFPQLISFLIFLIASNAELNRPPFDMAEAESELVAGFHTEYSGFRFAMFFMGEYVNLVTVSALASVMFLGGWHAPFGLPEIPLFWFLVKIFAFIIFYMWIRATLPRIRYDLLMAFGWKVLIPVGFLNLAVTAVVLTLAGDRAMPVLTAVNVTLAVVVGAAIKIAGRRVERRAPRLAPASEAGG